MGLEASRRLGFAGACAVGVLLAAACERIRYDPARATRPYPHQLHRAEAVDIQVFRDGQTIEIINSTARSYSDFDLWINQRYVDHIARLAPGQTIRLSLWDFYDERGEAINAGGFWRTEPPAPVRLVEIQPGPEQPMIGLIMIRE